MDDLDRYIEEREKREPGFKKAVEEKIKQRKEKNKAGREPIIWFTSDWH